MMTTTDMETTTGDKAGRVLSPEQMAAFKAGRVLSPERMAAFKKAPMVLMRTPGQQAADVAVTVARMPAEQRAAEAAEATAAIIGRGSTDVLVSTVEALMQTADRKPLASAVRQTLDALSDTDDSATDVYRPRRSFADMLLRRLAEDDPAAVLRAFAMSGM